MNFLNLSFLFIFFPVSFLLFHIIPQKFKKIFLILISIIFYSLGYIDTLIILIASTILNFIFGLLINKFKKDKMYLIIGILSNIGLLGFYKYLSFIISNFNIVFSTNLHSHNLILPLGISFFTFQSISYLVDVYNKKIECEKNFLNFLLYIVFFPKIISGPIVRYDDFKKNLNNIGKTNLKSIYTSIKRICFGLGKCLIISYTLGEFWKLIYDASTLSDISFLTAWLGIICYSFQLYFDFSGYTDMAIGIANLFGFNLPENFNYPYLSKSISEFWRKWHITLSSWFRDYIYIPLGGNRKGNVFFNLWVVFLCTGLWHGASWNFIFWGIYHGFWITIEKLIKNKNFYKNTNNLIKTIFTYIIVIVGWVLFASNGIKPAIKYLTYMSGFSFNNNMQFEFSYFLNSYTIFFLILSIICSLPIKNLLYNKIKNKNIYEFISGLSAIFVLIISIFFLINNSYKPFIYAQF